jgi:hypothetical protein
LKTSTINQVLKFLVSKKVSQTQSTPLFQKSAVDIPLLCGTFHKIIKTFFKKKDPKKQV